LFNILVVSVCFFIFNAQRNTRVNVQQNEIDRGFKGIDKATILTGKWYFIDNELF